MKKTIRVTIWILFIPAFLSMLFLGTGLIIDHSFLGTPYFNAGVIIIGVWLGAHLLFFMSSIANNKLYWMTTKELDQKIKDYVHAKEGHSIMKKSYAESIADIKVERTLLILDRRKLEGEKKEFDKKCKDDN